MKIGCKAVHLSKEPERLPVSEDVDTRGTASNIEDTNNMKPKPKARLAKSVSIVSPMSNIRS